MLSVPVKSSPVKVLCVRTARRAFSQLDDPAFRGVLLRASRGPSCVFVALHVGAIWLVHRLLALHGFWLGAPTSSVSIAASMLALWLFLPVAVAIGTMYFDRIARAVEGPVLPGASVAGRRIRYGTGVGRRGSGAEGAWA